MFRKIIIFVSILFVSYSTIIIGGLYTLDVTQKEPTHRADVIVSLGGGDGSRLKKAWQLYQDHYSLADKIVLTGSPVDPEKVVNMDPREIYLEKNKEILYEPISTLQASNTWEEALFIKQYMQKHSYRYVIIVTDPLHSGRVKMSLDRVAQFKKAGLAYTIVGDKKSNIDFLSNLLYDKRFRNYALSEVYKRIYYELKVLTL